MRTSSSTGTEISGRDSIGKDLCIDWLILPHWGFLPEATKGYNSALSAEFAFLVEKRTCRMCHVDLTIFTHLYSVKKAKKVRDSRPIANSRGRRTRPPL